MSDFTFMTKIVRDYCISQHKPVELQALQRAFVVEVLRTKQKWDESESTSTTIAKGKGTSE